MIAPAQSIEGRRVTSMTQAKLSEASGVSSKAVEEFEAGKRALNSTSLQALRAALEGAGWEEGSEVRSTRLRGITVDPRKQGRSDELE